MEHPSAGGASSPGSEVAIGAMTASDWPAVAEIYSQGLATGNATFETTVPDWEYWDRTRWQEGRLVARDTEGSVVGWAALTKATGSRLPEGVAEVSIYVAEASRGQGIGRKLLDRLVHESERAGIWTLQASVFPENEATLRLHTRAGFTVVGRREKIAMHDGRWRDTILLERRSDRVGRPAE